MNTYDKTNTMQEENKDNSLSSNKGRSQHKKDNWDGRKKEGRFDSQNFFTPTTVFSPIAKAERIPCMIPQTGHQVFTADKTQAHTLGSPVMSDHSSITYKTDQPDLFAKIYTGKALQIDYFENKAKRMVQEKIKIKGVCWPKALLTNSYGEFVGILVPASSGIQLSRSILNGNAAIKQFFPTWNKIDLCKASHTILNTIKKLQFAGIRFGCFNPASVYIVSPDEIYFVDTDNWQIEGYPTLSRNITFTPPELISEEQKPRLFNKDEENYQVALLTFMLMMPGKYPYAKRRGGNEYQSIKDMAFQFSVGGDMRRSADAERPNGAWQIIWDHLPYRMCNSFYNTFHANGRFSKPGTRPVIYEWINAIDEFEKVLQLDKNTESRDLIPRTFRRDDRREFATCKICNQEHPTFYFLRNIQINGEKINIWNKGYRVCLPCAVDKSNASFGCKSCGRTFYYNNRTKIIHEIGRLNFDWTGQKWCHSCKKHTVKCSRCNGEVPLYQVKEYVDRQRNLSKSVCSNCFSELINQVKQENAWKNALYATLPCRQCNGWFNVTNGEAKFFQDKGMSLPSRCPSCRGKR